MGCISPLDPHFALTLSEALRLNRADETRDIHAARRSLCRQSVPNTPIQKRSKFSVVYFPDRRMRRRKIVSGITALIEKEKSIFGNQVQFQAEFEQVTIL